MKKKEKPQNLLQLTKVGKKQNDTYFFKDVSFSIKPGETVSILGKKGTGKTALINCIAGEEKFTEGTVKYLGKRVNIKSDAEASVFRRDTHLIFYEVVPFLTIKENLQIAGRGSYKIQKQLLKYPGIRSLLKKETTEISSKEKFFICILRSLIHKPKIILIDDCGYDLSTKDMKDVLNFIKFAGKEINVAFILASDDPVISSISRINVNLSKL